MEARSVLWVVQQASMEMGLSKPVDAVANSDLTVQQLVALLNRAGMEMSLGFPWQQLTKEWNLSLVEGQSGYSVPDDWNYFLDQTQWDRTNNWPLLGPKTAQEWQWLKGGFTPSGPRLRYRVVGGKFDVFPSEGIGGLNIVMEYVSDAWLADSATANTFYSSIQADEDIVLFDPWVIVAFLKLKFWEAKGLDTTAYTKDFMGIWEARVSKNKGAPILSLAPMPSSHLLNMGNVPDTGYGV